MRYERTLADAGYVPFPNMESRNAVQARFEIPTLVRTLRLPQGGDILEIGCGRGIALEPLNELLRPRSLTGLDIDMDLLVEARVAAPAATLVHGDVRRLPFVQDSFDLIVDFGTCYHVADGDAALSGIERVLRPGGLFVHETPVAQLCAHPVRTSRRSLPWDAAPSLRPLRSALFWAARCKEERRV
jgi:ubiquinone/menaquinone biosynthesis C-methylase UbiE